MANITGTSNSEGLAGTNNADLIRGLAGNDTLFGLGGNDILDGGIGKDSMIGGSGNDNYIVDNSGDRIVESAGQGIDTVESSVTFTLGNQLENLLLTGSNAINGVGNSFGNVITGNGAKNLLSGNGGNDQLLGGAGNDTLRGSNSTAIGIIGDVDTLTGGTGADNFSLVTSTGTQAYIFDGDPDQGGYAIITDFKLTQGDKISLDGFASNYQLVGSGTGTDLFYIGQEQDKFELVAKINGVNLNNSYLQTSAFEFI